MASADPTEVFFNNLSSRGSDPLLHHASGTVRIDLVEDDRTSRWYVTISDGKANVSHKDARADTEMRTEKKLFDEMMGGTVNAMAALLRGALLVQGDIGLAASFQRMFPGPPSSQASFLERQEALARARSASSP